MTCCLEGVWYRKLSTGRITENLLCENSTCPMTALRARSGRKSNRGAYFRTKPRSQRRRGAKRHRVELGLRGRLPKNGRAVCQTVHAQSLVHGRASVRCLFSEPQDSSVFRIINFHEPVLASNVLEVCKTCFRHIEPSLLQITARISR